MSKIKNSFRNISFTQIFLVILFSFIIVQVVAKIFSNWFTSWDLRLGWIFQIFIVFMALALVFMFIVKKQATLEKKDFFVLIVLMAILIGLFLLLPKYIPEIFSISFPHATQQIMSIIG